MSADAKAKVLLLLGTPNVEGMRVSYSLRVFELPAISIRRSKQHKDDLILMNFLSADSDRCCRSSGQELRWCIEAQSLINCLFSQ